MEIRPADSKGDPEMSVLNLSPRNYGILAAALIALGAAGVFVYLRVSDDKQSSAKQDERAAQREAKGVRFKRPQDAKLRGIEAQNVRSAQWRPTLHVDGRVIPNPEATLEIHAPFAGFIRGAPDQSKLRLGESVRPLETLALLDARFTPLEALDLRAKLEDAKARHKAAEEVVKIRQEALGRKVKLPVGLLSQDDVDTASIQVAEAKMQTGLALTQWKLWDQALGGAAGKKTVVVPIQSPIAGEIVEIGAHPGANVDAGQAIARIVDFRRVLLRLDFPMTTAKTRPPASILVQALDATVSWGASLRGPAQSLESGLQKASWLYEILPDDEGAAPRWQAGLFVRAMIEDSSKPALPAILIPSSALLVHQGRTLVYIEKRLGRYERREVEILGRAADMLAIAAAGWLADEDRVVTGGAQVLLSEEFRNEVDED